jgi:hypothetical protein
MEKDRLSIFSFGNRKYHNFDIKKEQKEKKKKKELDQEQQPQDNLHVYFVLFIYSILIHPKKYLKKKS